MKKRTIILSLLLFMVALCYAQKVAIKNNLLYDATLTPNLGLEFGLGEKSTLEINAGYNPFTFSDKKKLKHWLVQPEYRWWNCEKFNGSFWGAHIHGGQYSIANLKLPFGIFPALKGHRYEGFFLGGGVSFGYQWMLGKRWNLETSLGAGYTYFKYNKYNCPDCGPKLKSGNYNYFGVTKAAISLIYIID